MTTPATTKSNYPILTGTFLIVCYAVVALAWGTAWCILSHVYAPKLGTPALPFNAAILLVMLIQSTTARVGEGRPTAEDGFMGAFVALFTAAGMTGIGWALSFTL